MVWRDARNSPREVGERGFVRVCRDSACPGDITGGERFVEPDPFLAGSADDVPRTAGPSIEVQRSPGVGPAPDEAMLRAVTTRSELVAV